MTPAERAPYDVDDAIMAVIEGPSPMPQAINPSKKELEYIIKHRDLDASQSFRSSSAAASYRILPVPGEPDNLPKQKEVPELLSGVLKLPCTTMRDCLFSKYNR